MLHPVAQLPKDILRHIRRVLGDEIDPHPLRPDQPRHLLHLGHQRLGRIVKQQMRLVKEEDELRLVRVAHLRQRLEQFRQQPQQEGRIKPRAVHQLVRRKDVDPPRPAAIHQHQIRQIQRRLPEQLRAPFVLQHQKPPLDRPDRGRRHQPIARRDRLGILPDEDQQRLQVLQIQKRQPLLIRQTEGHVQHALLRFRQFQKPRQQKRPHLRHRRPDRMPLFPEQVPEHHRKGAIGQVQPDLGRPFHEGPVQLVRLRPRRAKARQVALHIGHEHRHPGGREPFGHDLQRDRLARPRRPGDQPVAVAVFQQELLRQPIALAATAHENACLIGHSSCPRHPAQAPSAGRSNHIPASEHTCFPRPCQSPA